MQNSMESDHEPVFEFSPSKGRIPPGEELNVKVRYKPTTAFVFTCDTFRFNTPGGNSCTLECKAMSLG